MAANETLAKVFSRTRQLLNDTQVAGGRVFTDTFLLPFAQNAYEWLRLTVNDRSPADFRKRVRDLTYTANTRILDTLTGWPTDLWFPERVYFRKEAAEAYVELERADALPEPGDSNFDKRLTQWAYINRQAVAVPATEAGQVQLDYLAILPDLASASSPLLLDFAVSAMAYYTASDASMSRGQEGEANRFLGRKETPLTAGYGASHFADVIARAHVKNLQFVERHGRPLHGDVVTGLRPG